LEERAKQLIEEHKEDKNLSGMDLSGWDFSGADLSEWNLESTIFYKYDESRKVSIISNLAAVRFIETNLKEANLIRCNLQNAMLYKSDLQNALLFNADLQNAELGESSLQGADLTEANIQGADLVDANLYEVKLTNANLQNACLQGANLRRATLTGANLQNVSLWDTNLQNAHLLATDLRFAKFNSKTNLKNVNFYLSILDGSTLYFSKIDKIIINEKSFYSAKKKKDYKKMEKKGEEAQEIYLKLKNYLKQVGLYRKSGNYYYREMIMRRKLHWLNKRERLHWWIGSWLCSIICGYGEKIWRVFTTAFFIIIICSFYYYLLSGIMYGYDLSYNPTYWECLFFSIVTFSTLGYGDYRPKPEFIYQSIASFEALIGVFLLALFAFVIARRIMR
jgi:uncharacterized protein YjbI with pentapeptide repeats